MLFLSAFYKINLHCDITYSWIICPPPHRWAVFWVKWQQYSNESNEPQIHQQNKQALSLIFYANTWKNGRQVTSATHSFSKQTKKNLKKNVFTCFMPKWSTVYYAYHNSRRKTNGDVTSPCLLNGIKITFKKR